MPYTPGVEASLYENWPWAIRRLSVSTVATCLSSTDTLALGSVDGRFRQEFGLASIQEFSADLQAWLIESLARTPVGAYLKTSYGGFRGCPLSRAPVRTFDEATGVLRWMDERLLRHIRRRLLFKEHVWLLCRQWAQTPAQSEFRAFVADGQVIGITVYHCHLWFPQVEAKAPLLLRAMRDFLRGAIPMLHFQPIALDLRVDADDPALPVSLIELSPFDRCADAGLFNWDRPQEFRGGFRFRTRTGSREIMG